MAAILLIDLPSLGDVVTSVRKTSESCGDVSRRVFRVTGGGRGAEDPRELLDSGDEKQDCRGGRVVRLRRAIV